MFTLIRAARVRKTFCYVKIYSKMILPSTFVAGGSVASDACGNSHVEEFKIILTGRSYEGKIGQKYVIPSF
jgi:hypothetical protein